ncbi:MAG: MotE family protein, partial [Bdellovibrionales bacterium]
KHEEKHEEKPEVMTDEAAKPPELTDKMVKDGMAKKDKPMEIADEKDQSVEATRSKWRDASDDEQEYNNVKLELFDDLSARRKTLDQREKTLVTREALLKAAKQELDRKYQELEKLRAEIMDLLEQQSDAEKQRTAKLVKLYEGMKPKDAARIFDTLDLDVLTVVMGQMSERKLSPILAAMNPERARTVTIMLAEQKQLPELPQAN